MVSKYGKDFQVPQDFPSVLKAFTREVLRCQPENIYEFGATYFSDLYDTLASEGRGARKLTGAELEAFLRQLFAEHDIDGSGDLSLKEFKALMQNADLGLSNKDMKVIMAQADVNKDGTISYAEFVPLAVEIVQAMEARQSVASEEADAAQQAEQYLRTGMSEDELRGIMSDVFQKADADGSGHLSYEEFMDCLTEADIGLTRTEMKALLIKVDIDQDGKISYAEFQPLCFELLQEIMAEEMLRKGVSSVDRELGDHLLGVFERADSAGTGKLAPKQLRDALVAADLGLTKIQLATILAEACDEEVDIAKFARVCATMINAMESPQAVRARAEAKSQLELVHGVPKSELSGVLVKELLAYDPKGAGLIGQAQLREALTNSSLGLSKKEVSALLSAINADDSGLVAYAPLCDYAAKLLAHMATELTIY